MARDKNLLELRNREIKQYFNALTKGACRNWKTEKIIEEKISTKFYLSPKRIYAILASA
jgi:RNA-splicing ligase RtcB